MQVVYNPFSCKSCKYGPTAFGGLRLDLNVRDGFEFREHQRTKSSHAGKRGPQAVDYGGCSFRPNDMTATSAVSCAIFEADGQQ